MSEQPEELLARLQCIAGSKGPLQVVFTDSDISALQCVLDRLISAEGEVKELNEEIRILQEQGPRSHE